MRKRNSSYVYSGMALILLMQIILLPFTSFSVNVVNAAEDVITEDTEYGQIQNEEGKREYDEAIIDKKVSEGSIAGEYIIDLEVEGKSYTKEKEVKSSADVVIVYDNSNSMDEPMQDLDGENSTRAKVAKSVTSDFVNGLLENDDVRVALVTYGSAVFDGGTYNWISGNLKTTQNFSHKTLTNDPSPIINKLPSNVPSDRSTGGGSIRSSYSNHGGTHTQHGLQHAGDILDNSDADNKIIVTITDGLPTFSFRSNGTINGTGSSTSTSIINETIGEANVLKDKYDGLYSIGLGLGNSGDAHTVINGLASEPGNAYEVGADDVDDLQESLQNILTSIETSTKKSISEGIVTDPIGDMFFVKDDFSKASDEDLTDGDYFLSSDDVDVDDIDVDFSSRTINLSNITLGKEEKLNLRYKVQLNTEDDDFENDTFYDTNGTTTLTPKSDEPDNKKEFPVPKAKVKGTDVDVEKKWELFEKSKTEIDVNLLRNDEVFNSVELKESNDWKHTFDDLIVFDNSGELYEYTVEEVKIDGFEVEITGDQKNGYTITNTEIVEQTPLEPAMTSVDVEKVWKGEKLDAVTVHLLADGEKVDEEELSDANDWKHTFTDLPVVHDITDEEAIKYTVEEVDVDGYKSTVEGSAKDGFTITNLRTGKTDISGEKIWQDNEDEIGKRPESITVNLLQDEEVVDSQEVSAATDWAFSFTGLAEFDKSGEPYEYTVEEADKLEDYTVSYDEESYNITNTIKPQPLEPAKTSVHVNKVWKGEAQGSVDVNLLANGEVKDTVTLSSGNSWSHTFEDLPVVNDIKDENAIEYTVEEVAIDGYESTIDGNAKEGFTITNLRTGQTDVSGKKIWQDNEDEIGKRPESITVNLLQNGEVIDSQSVSAATDWTFSFTSLAEFDASGQPYDYTVREADNFDDYYVSYDDENYNITNTIKPQPLEPAMTSVHVNKVWKGEALGSVEVRLLADGEVKDTATLSNDNSWSHVFADLPVVNDIEDENPIDYTVEEVSVDGYESTIEGNAKEGFTITNLRTGVRDISGEKIWQDNENEIGKRPESITVNLLQNGDVVDSQEVSEATGWAFTFAGVAEFDGSGQPYDYTVREANSFDDYYVSYDEESFNITNTIKPQPLEPAMTSVDVEKVWKGKKQDSITVNLLADGEKIAEQQLSDTNGWKHTFTDLPVVHDVTDEKAIAYTVEEVGVEGYKSTVDGNAKEGFTITNLRTGKTDVSGEKIWDDNEDELGKRPESITVHLLQNGEVIDSQKVSAEQDWTFTFDGLAEFDKSGKRYDYTVEEADELEEYEVSYDEESYNITNTIKPQPLEPANTSVSVKKVWEGKAQDSVVIHLLADGEVIDKVTLSDENDWKHTFKDLPVVSSIEDKDAIKYTVEEVEIDGYEASIEGNAKDGFTITNTEITDDEVVKESDHESSDNDGGSVLPKTATDYFNMIAIGLALIIIGSLAYVFLRRRTE